MKIKALSYISASELFTSISNSSSYTPHQVKELFERHTDVSIIYADISLISMARFLEECNRVPEFREDEDIYIPLRFFIKFKDVYVEMDS